MLSRALQGEVNSRILPGILSFDWSLIIPLCYNKIAVLSITFLSSVNHSSGLLQLGSGFQKHANEIGNRNVYGDFSLFPSSVQLPIASWGNEHNLISFTKISCPLYKSKLCSWFNCPNFSPSSLLASFWRRFRVRFLALSLLLWSTLSLWVMLWPPKVWAADPEKRSGVRKSLTQTVQWVKELPLGSICVRCHVFGPFGSSL